jgi:hypothetical protein
LKSICCTRVLELRSRLPDLLEDGPPPVFVVEEAETEIEGEGMASEVRRQDASISAGLLNEESEGRSSDLDETISEGSLLELSSMSWRLESPSPSCEVEAVDGDPWPPCPE